MTAPSGEDVEKRAYFAMKRICIGLVVALVTIACNNSGGTETPGSTRECDAEPGSAIDLASEPSDWLQHGTYLRWTDGDGCLVRIDVISHHHGAAHCGWQSMEAITIGRPFGSSIASGASAGNRYLWDPQAVLPDGPFGVELSLADMPDTALDTGYRRDGAELWRDEGNESVLYRVTGNSVEVFELSSSGLCQ